MNRGALGPVSGSRTQPNRLAAIGVIELVGEVPAHKARAGRLQIVHELGKVEVRRQLHEDVDVIRLAAWARESGPETVHHSRVAA
jgi:hypothetical protein